MERKLPMTGGPLVAALLLVLVMAPGCADPDAAVINAVKAEFPQAAVGEMEKETEGGVVVYEVELVQDGKEIEVTVTSGGVIMEVEREIAQAELPPAVAAAIAKAAGGAKIEEIEREEIRAVVRDGKVVKLDKPKIVYEAEFRKAGREVEVEVAADGTILKTESEDDDDNDDDDDDDDDKDDDNDKD